MVSFDAGKLKMVGGLDMDSAIRHFVSYQMFFDELERFLYESGNYLRSYTPTVVIYDEITRNNFLEETDVLLNTLMNLGMLRMTAIIFDLKSAVEANNDKTLSDTLLVFFSEIEIMANAVASARTVQNEVQPAPQNDRPLILAVDDKPELLTAIVNMLEDLYRVMGVTSGKAALKAIDKHSPVLFLLDIEMPQMDGFMLAELIRDREMFKNTPIIFLTSKNARQDVMTAISTGVNDYIVKPVQKEALLERIRKHLK